MELSDSNLRLLFFFLGLPLFLLLGLIAPTRRVDYAREKIRWLNNIGLTFLNALLLKLIIGGSLVSLCLFLREKDFGIFNWINLPYQLNFFVSIILLDYLIYWQHRYFHTIPKLWLLHRVHHTDVEFDTTTALRFHTIEIFLSIGIKALAILIFGIHASGFVVFEIILNFSAMFNHGNFSLGPLDKYVRKVIVTPDMHRIHHTRYMEEINSNYGFFFSFWDKLHKSYSEAPRDPQESMQIGLDSYRDQGDQRLDKLLTQPFR